MKFGKLGNIEDVDFSLPEDPVGNATILSSHQVNAKQLYIGCTGWSMKEWVGKVYPKGTKTKDFLQAYAKQFNTIELNTTHYRIPNVETIDKWRSESSDDFRFCPKVPQAISHRKDLGLSSQNLRLFWDAIAGLDEKLGCCFIQVPPHFGIQKIGLLEQLLEIWPHSIPLAVEVRHASWFETAEAQRQLLNLLAKYQKAAVITDVAGRRDVLHMGVTCPIAMVRFVGNGLHESDYQRSDAWKERLQRWFDQGLESAYFFTHEPDNILAPELAAYLHSIVQLIPGINTRGPKFLEDQGEQLSLFG
ncbi:MAG: DUF72 domain-containing protein [Bacteroidota bacterium]